MPNIRSYYAITIACSLSIMFDEASDINMNGNLNVFVNVCLYSGEVRTLTLALQGIVTYTNAMISYLYLLYYPVRMLLYICFMIVRIRGR